MHVDNWICITFLSIISDNMDDEKSGRTRHFDTTLSSTDGGQSG